MRHVRGRVDHLEHASLRAHHAVIADVACVLTDHTLSDKAALVLLAIPFAMVEGLLALMLGGLYLSVPAAVGFIALSGVAVLNGVVKIAYINQLRAQGMPLDEAVLSGMVLHVHPVLMTAVVAMMALTPLLLATGPGSEIQRPLATVVIGGSFSSTVLTLVVLPVLYRWVEP
jgi:heavy metal efflux system protein